MTILNDYVYTEEQILRHRRRAVSSLMISLRQYYLWYAPNASGADLDNLIQQGVDAAAAVLHSYPPLVEKE